MSFNDPSSFPEPASDPPSNEAPKGGVDAASLEINAIIEAAAAKVERGVELAEVVTEDLLLVLQQDDVEGVLDVLKAEGKVEGWMLLSTDYQRDHPEAMVMRAMVLEWFEDLAYAAHQKVDFHRVLGWAFGYKARRVANLPDEIRMRARQLLQQLAAEQSAAATEEKESDDRGPSVQQKEPTTMAAAAERKAHQQQHDAAPKPKKRGTVRVTVFVVGSIRCRDPFHSRFLSF